MLTEVEGSLRQGSAKDVYTMSSNGRKNECLKFVFSDRVSVLDIGPLPIEFAGLGKLRCAIAGRIFQEMEESGFRTHYLSHDVETASMFVEPFDIRELEIHYTNPEARGRIVALEFIFRWVATEKLMRRINNGDIDVERFDDLLAAGDILEADVRFESPFLECTTKFQDADTYVSDEKAAMIANVGPDWLRQKYNKIEVVAHFLSKFFERNGFNCLDGKFEGAITYALGNFILADSISPDELRLVGNDGQSYDKDIVREHIKAKHPAWYKTVEKAKKEHPTDKSMWPKYPPNLDLPAELVEEVVGRYRTVAKAIGALG